MLKLRPATVLDTEPLEEDPSSGADGDAPSGQARVREQRLVVELRAPGGLGDRRAAIADVTLVGRAEVGDEVIVNVEALDLGLGSGGFDVVHVNLPRGLEAQRDLDPAEPGRPHGMKLNYTSLQHAVE